MGKMFYWRESFGTMGEAECIDWVQGSGLWWQLRCKIYIRGEAATFIPHLSKAFIQGQGTARPTGEPRTLNHFIIYTQKTLRRQSHAYFFDER